MKRAASQVPCALRLACLEAVMALPGGPGAVRRAAPDRDHPPSAGDAALAPGALVRPRSHGRCPERLPLGDGGTALRRSGLVLAALPPRWGSSNTM
jgi:hypothetical protein